MSSDEERFLLLRRLMDYGFVVVQRVPSHEQATERLARLVSIIRETPHGRISDVESLPKVHNLAYSSIELSPHTDGSYHYDAPGPMLFHFMETQASGGETVLVDGFAVAETLRREAPRSFNLLCQLQWRHAFASPDMDIRAEASVIGLTADGTYDRIVFKPLHCRSREFRRRHRRGGLPRVAALRGDFAASHDAVPVSYAIGKCVVFR